jgi:hypothetical protein
MEPRKPTGRPLSQKLSPGLWNISDFRSADRIANATARKHRLTAYVRLSLLVPGPRWTQGSGRAQSAGSLPYRWDQDPMPILQKGAPENGRVTHDAAPQVTSVKLV